MMQQTKATPQRPPLRAVEVDSQELRVRAPESVGQLLSERLPEDQVAGLLPRKSACVLYGDASAGKTFFALDLAACIAAGREFAGLKVKQGAVLYLIAEGHAGFTKRLRALAQKHPDLPALPIRVIRQAIDMRGWQDDLALRARDVADDVGPLGLIVVDTLAQTLRGDENSGEDMAGYVGAANRLATETGAPVLILHHQGKDGGRGMRGSSALRGNIDVAILIKGDADGNRLATTDPTQGAKCRDDEPVSLGFSLRVVPVGRDEGGREVTSCVVDYQEPPAQTQESKPVGKAQRLLLQLAVQLALASRRYRPDSAPLFTREELAGVWGAAMKAAGRAKQAAPSYMNRPLTDLIDGGHLCADGGDLWFPRR